MNTVKLWKSMALALALTLALGACSGNGTASTTGTNGGSNGGAAGNDANGGGNDSAGASAVSQLPVLTASPYQLSGSEEGTADFLAANAGYESPYQNDTCLNITPSFFPADSGLSVFKYGASNETFVLYDGAVYAIGSDSSGDGVTSMAMADFTGDGAYELYYAYSNGADSYVGLFDPASKTSSGLSGSFSGQPVVLSADGSTLTVCGATVSDYESLTSMTLTAGDVLANVTAADGKVSLEMTEAGAAAAATE